MNKRYNLIVFLFICNICSAQNLVPNGDFEQFTTCPVNLGNFEATFWTSPTQGSPDYFNICAPAGVPASVPGNNLGYQSPHSGGAYCGGDIFTQPPFVPEYREYMEVMLTSPLIANNSYHFEMYVNHSNYSQFATDDIGAYFSNTLISGITNWAPLPYTPQVSNAGGIIIDTLNWTLISGNFTAAGGEQYLIIGNFKDDANTTFQLAYPTADYQFTYYYFDDVSLTDITGLEEPGEIAEVKIYPNPFLNNLNVTVSSNEQSELVLYDITSRKLSEYKFNSTVSINTEQLAAGIYIFEVRNNNRVIKKGKVVKE